MSGLEHFDEEIGALDQRIGRLALLCGADLSQVSVVTALIKGNFAVCRQAPSGPADLHHELRALLLMKYRIELSCIESIGTEQCARLIAEQDDRLRRHGFPPQALADAPDPQK